jgi:hypothetical protein
VGVEPLLVVTQDCPLDIFMEHIDLGRRELACANALLEEHVQLSEGAATRLGDTKVGIDDAEEADTTLGVRLLGQGMRTRGGVGGRR